MRVLSMSPLPDGTEKEELAFQSDMSPTMPQTPTAMLVCTYPAQRNVNGRGTTNVPPE